jgi:hypothetical protein
MHAVNNLSEYLQFGSTPDRGRRLIPVWSSTGGNLVATFDIAYYVFGLVHNQIYTTFLNHLIGFKWTPRYVEPSARFPGGSDAWNLPFFFEDRRNLFYVTTVLSLMPVADFAGFGWFIPSLAAVNGSAPAFGPQAKLRMPRSPILARYTAGGGLGAVQRTLSHSVDIRVGAGSDTPLSYHGGQISLR